MVAGIDVADHERGKLIFLPRRAPVEKHEATRLQQIRAGAASGFKNIHNDTIMPRRPIKANKYNACFLTTKKCIIFTSFYSFLNVYARP